MQMPAFLSRLFTPKRHMARRFDAAQYNRLTSSFAQAERSINTELRADLDALRRRSRDLAKNEPLAQKYLEMVTTNVVGANGFTLQARVSEMVKKSDGTFEAKQDGLANTAIEAAWLDWSKATNCDVSGRMSFPDMTRAITRGVARDGEALVRIRDGANNPYGYALQYLDIERLDTMLNREPSQGVNQIIMGVEMDVDGRAVAYHLLTAPLGRDPTGKKHARIPEGEIIHMFIADDPEQVRGIPWMHASMIRIQHLK
jgi:lambda family phage portal protein